MGKAQRAPPIAGHTFQRVGDVKLVGPKDRFGRRRHGERPGHQGRRRPPSSWNATGQPLDIGADNVGDDEQHRPARPRGHTSARGPKQMPLDPDRRVVLEPEMTRLRPLENGLAPGLHAFARTLAPGRRSRARAARHRPTWVLTMTNCRALCPTSNEGPCASIGVDDPGAELLGSPHSSAPSVRGPRA